MLKAEERALLLQAEGKRAKAEALDHWLEGLAAQKAHAGQKRPRQEHPAPPQSNREEGQSQGVSASAVAKKPKQDRVAELPNAFKIDRYKDVVARKVIHVPPKDMPPFAASGAKIKAAEVKTAGSSKWLFCVADIAAAYFSTKTMYHTIDILKKIPFPDSNQPRIYLIQPFGEKLNWMGGFQTVFCDGATVASFVSRIMNKKGLSYTVASSWRIESFLAFLVRQTLDSEFN